MKLIEKLALDFAKNSCDQEAGYVGFGTGFKLAKDMIKQRIDNAYVLGFIHGDIDTIRDVISSLGEEKV